MYETAVMRGRNTGFRRENNFKTPSYLELRICMSLNNDYAEKKTETITQQKSLKKVYN